jgi:asparagine synthase (glutamine-hydrolysing)
MCGLVGIAGPRPSEDDVRRMLSTIAHRGPDGEGVHVMDDAAVGHVRLAIVDPTPAGAQPMCTPDGRYCLAYNGELYNHGDFRPALESRGIRFRGHSDTETLLWLLAERGLSILPKLNGIFAFAFVDTVTHRVLLARDHLGVKPLYHARGAHGRLLFASEIKALFATGEVERRANVDDLLELLMFHFIAGERTAFASVTELRPGHAAVWEDGALRVHQFWDPIAAARDRLETDGHLTALLRAAVHRQLMADVPIGVMSSGGLDSGVVTAVAGPSHNGMRGLCFRDPAYGYDELSEARALATPFGVQVEEVTIDADEVPDLLHRAAWHHDEPLPRPHHLAAYAIARRAREDGLKVLVSGEGGDELFGGYVRYAEMAALMQRSGDLSPLVFGQNRVALPRIARFWAHDRFENTYRQECAERTSGFDLVNRQLLVDQLTFLQHFLQRSDRMGMAAGVEIRVPLLDVPLVEYSNRLPGSFKVANGCTKVALKASLDGLLPDVVLRRRKQAFEMPMAPLLQHGPVADLVDDLLLDRPRCGEIFDRAGIQGLVRDLRNGDEDLWKAAWLLLTTEIWMRTFDVSV